MERGTGGDAATGCSYSFLVRLICKVGKPVAFLERLEAWYMKFVHGGEGSLSSALTLSLGDV